jgi:hypothetical protein
MGKTIKVSELSNPQIRVRMGKNGRAGFIHVGRGNPDAIKSQQNKMVSCAAANRGKKGMQFKSGMKSCLGK